MTCAAFLGFIKIYGRNRINVRKEVKYGTGRRISDSNILNKWTA